MNKRLLTPFPPLLAQRVRGHESPQGVSAPQISRAEVIEVGLGIALFAGEVHGAHVGRWVGDKIHSVGGVGERLDEAPAGIGSDAFRSQPVGVVEEQAVAIRGGHVAATRVQLSSQQVGAAVMHRNNVSLRVQNIIFQRVSLLLAYPCSVGVVKVTRGVVGSAE